MEKLFFDETLKLLAEEKSSVIYKIRVDIADYWSWFKLENKTILMQRNAGLSKQFEFTIAPVLEKRNRQRKGETGTQDEEISVKAIDKYYLIWKQFDNTSYRRKNPHTSSYIKVAKPENIINVVGKKCCGEYEKFVETEKKLAPLRQILDAIHRTEIAVISEQRKYLRRFNQKNHVIQLFYFMISWQTDKLHLIYHPIATVPYHVMQINRTTTFTESTTSLGLGFVPKAEIR